MRFCRWFWWYIKCFGRKIVWNSCEGKGKSARKLSFSSIVSLIQGTHAHAYITSFTGVDELVTRELPHKESGQFWCESRRLKLYSFGFTPGCSANLLELAIEHRKNLTNVLKISTAEASDGELAAMVSFAIAFPNGFMALVDTYDVKRYIFSFGALNFSGSSLFFC